MTLQPQIIALSDSERRVFGVVFADFSQSPTLADHPHQADFWLQAAGRLLLDPRGEFHLDGLLDGDVRACRTLCSAMARRCQDRGEAGPAALFLALANTLGRAQCGRLRAVLELDRMTW